MTRRLITIAPAISLLACVYCVITATAVAIIGDRNFVHWDVATGRWQPDNFRRERLACTALSAVFGVLPFLWIRRQIRARAERRRRRLWTCVQCGYDLRASKARCSECGTPIPSDVGTQA